VTILGSGFDEFDGNASTVRARARVRVRGRASVRG